MGPISVSRGRFFRFCSAFPTLERGMEGKPAWAYFGSGRDTTSTRTRTTPARIMPILSAAARERSIMRFLLLNGPRSLMRTSTERRLERLVTRTTVPKRSLRCAAVIGALLPYPM